MVLHWKTKKNIIMLVENASRLRVGIKSSILKLCDRLFVTVSSLMHSNDLLFAGLLVVGSEQCHA